MDVCGSPSLPYLVGILVGLPLGLVMGAIVVKRITVERINRHSQMGGE